MSRKKNKDGRITPSFPHLIKWASLAVGTVYMGSLLAGFMSWVGYITGVICALFAFSEAIIISVRPDVLAQAIDDVNHDEDSESK